MQVDLTCRLREVGLSKSSMVKSKGGEVNARNGDCKKNPQKTRSSARASAGQKRANGGDRERGRLRHRDHRLLGRKHGGLSNVGGIDQHVIVAVDLAVVVEIPARETENIAAI